MRVETLVLDNFRSHERLRLEFERDVTVLIGDNAAGKTSVLDAISQVFGRLLVRLPGVAGISTSAADIRLTDGEHHAEAMRLWLKLNITDELAYLDPTVSETSIAVSRSRVRDGSVKTRRMFMQNHPAPGILGTKSFDDFATRLAEANDIGSPFLMPLVVYYGTERAVFATPLRRRNFKKEFARFDSMNGALRSEANFRRVFEWFHAKETAEVFEQKKRRSFAYYDPALQVVREAISTFLKDYGNPRTLLRPLRFVVDRATADNEVTTFDLNQLSDGYRTALALVADLASRMVEANPPQAGFASLDMPAVVLIDEVDLHLHPGWQQTILRDLRATFKNTQFIVSTHSPQVLSTVEPRCIRRLIPAKEKTQVEFATFSLGARSGELLEDLQGVAERPKLDITEKLVRYKKLVALDKFDSHEAHRLRADLDRWAGNQEAELKKIDVDIRVRKFRRDGA